MEYHVSIEGNDGNAGLPEQPLRTIQYAADLAVAGDDVVVHEGVYRESVDPPRGGSSDSKRITFRAADGEAVAIKGSEIVTDWVHQGGSVWLLTLPNDYFGAFNPFANILTGDWLFPQGMTHHSGAVYINDQALNEAATLESLFNGMGRKWFGKSDNVGTHVWVSCGDLDPNRELTEINVRKSVFYPSRPGINYITVSGFNLSQAATPWSPPTSEQIGLIGTNWSKGWVIEGNTITHSRCTGITLGKYFDRDDCQIEYGFNAHYQTVKRVLARGDWNKETVGGHVVRNNHIAFCEQSGIVGSHGAAFCEIYGNDIHHIHTRRLFGGFEQAGIKIHGAVDTTIRNNVIHDSWMGIWLDWMNQGSRVSSNVFFNNDNWGDLFIEIAHGPVLVDNNIMLSPRSLYDSAQGGAYVHNLFGGEVQQRAETQRKTPYFLPHSTTAAGDSMVFDGDERFFNNLVLGESGLAHYDANQEPVWIDANVYLYRAAPSSRDEHAVSFPDADTRFRVRKDGPVYYLELKLDSEWGRNAQTRLITTELMGTTIVTGQRFENPDGSPLSIDTDMLGRSRSEDNPFPGPLELTESVQRIAVWSVRAGAETEKGASIRNEAHNVEDR